MLHLVGIEHGNISGCNQHAAFGGKACRAVIRHIEFHAGAGQLVNAGAESLTRTLAKHGFVAETVQIKRQENTLHFVRNCLAKFQGKVNTGNGFIQL